MHAKVKPPVTPRILPGGSQHRIRNGTLIVLALLLTAWVGYELGRGSTDGELQQSVATSGNEDSSQWETRLEELERERDNLQLQVSELERQLTEADRRLEEASARKPAEPAVTAKETATRAEPKSNAAIVKEVTPPSPEPVPAEKPIASSDDGRELELYQVRLDNTEDDNRYKLQFTVRHAGETRVTGTIWVAVNGFTNGKPSRLSFKTVSPDRRPYIKMGFNSQQDVDEVLVLPAGFRPKNVLIEAKPYSEKFEGASMKYKWITG